jgi:hypothetical protein
MATYRAEVLHDRADQVVVVRFRVPGRAATHTPDQVRAALVARVAETWVQPFCARTESARVTKV